MMSHRRTRRGSSALAVALLLCALLAGGATAFTVWHAKRTPAVAVDKPQPKSKRALDGFTIGGTKLHAGTAELVTYVAKNGERKQLEVDNGSLNPYKHEPIKLRPAGTCSSALQPGNKASEACVPEIGKPAKLLCNDGLHGFGVALPMDLIDDSSTVQRWLKAKTPDGKDVAVGYIWIEYIKGGNKAVFDLNYNVDLPNCADIVRE